MPTSQSPEISIDTIFEALYPPTNVENKLFNLLGLSQEDRKAVIQATCFQITNFSEDTPTPIPDTLQFMLPEMRAALEGFYDTSNFSDWQVVKYYTMVNFGQ